MTQKHKKISTAEQWKSSAPAEIRERGIKDYLKDVRTPLICSFFSKKKHKHTKSFLHRLGSIPFAMTCITN